MKYRIWIDQDSTIYDLSSPWYAAHNKDYPQHDLRVEDVNGWDTSAICKRVECPADIYSYFNLPEVWSNGQVIDGAKEIIDRWHNQNIADLGILTTAANGMSMPYKIEWINNNFPYIKDIIIGISHTKHLIRGDILIDDGVHNLTKWQGVKILYNQPWNQESNILRAMDWKHVDIYVRDAIELLDDTYTYTHKQVQTILESRYIKETK